MIHFAEYITRSELLTTLEPEHALSITVKAHNDSANEYGLVPSLLVFGIRPRLNVGFNDARPNQAARFQSMTDPRPEMEKHIAERRISVALSKKTLGYANRTYYPGDEVMFFREKFDNLDLHKWIGPFKVIQQTGKNLKVQDTEPWGVKIFKYHIDQFKPLLNRSYSRSTRQSHARNP